MKNLRWLWLVPVTVALLCAAYTFRKAPLPLTVAISPFFAMFWLISQANPAKPNSWTIRFLNWIGLYPLIQRLNTQTASWHILARVALVIFAILWFIYVSDYWPVGWSREPLVK